MLRGRCVESVSAVQKIGSLVWISGFDVLCSTARRFMPSQHSTLQEKEICPPLFYSLPSSTLQGEYFIVRGCSCGHDVLSNNTMQRQSELMLCGRMALWLFGRVAA